VFAHTIVEAPKYGASSRTAAISAPSEPVPTTKTSNGRGGMPQRTIAIRAHSAEPNASGLAIRAHSAEPNASGLAIRYIRAPE
jgi:hypothetical protein